MPICGITVAPVAGSVTAKSSLDIVIGKLTERVRRRHNLAKWEVDFCHHSPEMVETCRTAPKEGQEILPVVFGSKNWVDEGLSNREN